MKLFLLLLLLPPLSGLEFPLKAQSSKDTLPREHLNFDEPYNLIELLRLPAKTQITWKPGSLPHKPNYKIFVGSRLDFALEDEIKSFIKRWNQQQGNKHGSLQSVAAPAEADVILAKYQSPRETIEETVIIGHTTGPKHITGTEKTTSLRVPHYAYLLVPQTDGYEIIWRQRKLVAKGSKLRRNGAGDLLTALTRSLQRQ